MLAGMIIRPRATSLRSSSGSSFSRLATYCISSVIAPCRARCICETLRFPFAPAAAAFPFFNPAIAQSHKTPSETAARARGIINPATPDHQFEMELWHLRMDAATSRCNGLRPRPLSLIEFPLQGRSMLRPYRPSSG